MTDHEPLEVEREAPLSTFFCQDLGAPEAGGESRFGPSEAAHLRAARVRPGDRIAVTDGVGSRWQAELIELARRGGRCRLERPIPTPPPYPVRLWAPVGNRDRSLWLVEKAVELGVESVLWVVWARSRSVSDAGRSRGFLERVRARARAALVQCGGAWLPQLEGPAELAEALEGAGEGARWLADREGRPALAAALDFARGRHGAAASITVAVGPEGGVTPEERLRCLDAGLEPVSLGSRTLRFETAALAALSLVTAAIEAERSDA